MNEDKDEKDKEDKEPKKPNLSAAARKRNIEMGLPEDFVEWQDPRLLEEAEERNTLLAALDEVNPGNRHSWKLGRKEFVLLFGKDSVKGNEARPGYEYKGLPVEIEE